jgi:hypothetical protein
LVIKEWLREIKGIDLYDFVKAFKTWLVQALSASWPV